nr:MAG TPA: hypothetical protein [Caudoviricetes sp.]
MKTDKTVVWKYWDKVLSAHKYFWSGLYDNPYESHKLIEDNEKSIKAFFESCAEKEMEYNEFIKKVNDEYGTLLESYRQEKQAKLIAGISTIKGILIFFLIMYILGIIIGIIVLSQL